MYSFGFQHNIVNENGFGLFAFCRTVFSARVEQDLTQFTDWPNLAGNMGSQVNCGALSQTLTESKGKIGFGSFVGTFCKTVFSVEVEEHLKQTPED